MTMMSQYFILIFVKRWFVTMLSCRPKENSTRAYIKAHERKK